MTLTTNWQLIKKSPTETWNLSKIRLEIWGKYNSQNIANNTSNWSIKARLVIETSGGYILDQEGVTLTLSGTGISSTQNLGTGYFRTQDLGSASGTATHNADGTKTVSASASVYFKAWRRTISVSGSATLPTIPRDFTQTPKVIFQSATTTNATFRWETSETCDAVVYSVDGGAGVNCFSGSATSGTFTVNGLEPNSTHDIYIWARRKDSQRGMNSSHISFTTSSKTMRLKINGAWIEGTPYIKVNGVWKVAVPYIKINGSWKRCS